jgi:23S rRNA (adenine2503-C2)-methyltransferase
MAIANKMMTKRDIKSLPPQELVHWLTERGMAAYRANQILKWVYARQVDDFEIMTDLSKADRRTLAAAFKIERLAVQNVQRSVDGSEKFLFELHDGNCVESVLIPERDHYTLCISSQVGCAQGCRFCMTARSGFVRNLDLGEILAQVRDVLRRLDQPEQLRNIVFMGMGEPLANYRNVVAAANMLIDNTVGFGFAGKRITLSTAGLVPRLLTLGHDTPVNLAVSLNAADDETRSQLMPINRRYPIGALLDACRRYPLKPHRRITFEYILLEGVNDAEKDARQLAKLLQPLRAKINLIPFNTHPGCRWQRPADEVIARFQQILLDKHYTVIVRHSKGQDIAAACGQLRGMGFAEDVG